MKKYEVKNALDSIREMSDNEIIINSEYIRKVALHAYDLIKSLESAKYKKKFKC